MLGILHAFGLNLVASSGVAPNAIDETAILGLSLSLPYALIHTLLGLTSLSHGLRAPNLDTSLSALRRRNSVALSVATPARQAGTMWTSRQASTERSPNHGLVNILAWIIVGGIAGWLASLLVQGTGMGIVGDIIVGIVGALIGGFVLSLLLPGTFGFTGFNLGSLIVAFIGAVILLFIVKLFTGRRAVS